MAEILLLELCSLEASIYEAGCSHEFDPFGAQSNRRIECLCSCVNAVKSCITVFGRFKPAQYIELPFIVYAAISRCLTVFYRLLTFENPEWDQTLMRETLDFHSLMDEYETKFSRVAADAGLDYSGSDDSDPYTLMAAKVRKIRMLWVATISGTTALGQGSDAVNEIATFSLDNIDEDWFRDLLGLWNQC